MKRDRGRLSTTFILKTTINLLIVLLKAIECGVGFRNPRMNPSIINIWMSDQSREDTPSHGLRVFAILLWNSCYDVTVLENLNIPTISSASNQSRPSSHFIHSNIIQ